MASEEVLIQRLLRFDKKRPETLRSINEILELGADPNMIYSEDGVCAMLLAAGLGFEVTSLLLQHHGEPNIQSLDGTTPLHVAASWGDLETLKLLLFSGANVHMTDQEGKTALDLAIENDHLTCVQELKTHTMLTVFEDTSSSPKFTLEEKTDDDESDASFSLSSGICSSHGDQDSSYEGEMDKTVVCDLDKSVIEPELLSSNYSSSVTEQVYESLRKGMRVCFDATSPTTPIVSLKPHFSDSQSKRLPGIQAVNVPDSHHSRSPPTDHQMPFLCSTAGLQHNCNQYPTQSHQTVGTYFRYHPEFYHPNRSNQHRYSSSFSSSPHCGPTVSTCHSNSSNNRKLSTNSQNCQLRTHISSTNSPNHPISGHNSSPKSPNFPVSMCSLSNNFLSTCSHVPSSSSPNSKVRARTSPIHSPKRQGSVHSSSTKISTRPFSSHTSATSSPNQQLRTHTASTNPPNQPDRMHISSTNSPKKQSRLHTSSTNSPNCLIGSHSSSTNSPNHQIRTHTSSNNSPSNKYSYKSAKSDLTSRFDASLTDNCDPFVASNSNDAGGGSAITDACGDLKTHSSLPATTKDFNSEYTKHIRRLSTRLSDVKINDTALLPVSHVSSDLKTARTAEFVLSCPEVVKVINDISVVKQDSTSRTHPYENNNVKSRRASSKDTNNQNDKQKLPLYGVCAEENQVNSTVKRNNDNLDRKDSLPNESVETLPFNTSGSSCGSFSTCKSFLDHGNDSSDRGDALLDFKRETQQIHNQEQSPAPEDKKREFLQPQTPLLNVNPKWRPPCFPIANEDLMTSDESFIQREVSKKRKSTVIRNKAKTSNEPVLKDSASSSPPSSFQAHSAGLSQHKGNMPQRNLLRLSDDSLFSTVSVREYLYTDKERGITLIERHIPSECGSSVGRRSIDSVASKVSADSKASIDSQCTLIYDWRSLCQKSKSEHGKGKDNSGDEASDRDQVGDSEGNVAIPSWITKMSNEEVTTKLQKYGEIVGPVVGTTRQVYLRRLASLESNPGLVCISKSCPDYPCELRKELNGVFDSTVDLAQLEAEMTRSFDSSHGRQWREGTVKSSFTYLLLDPRVTKNLPLRAKELGDLEAFKCFICSIFYIGKGKRARPYCHLYEAVSKMKKKSDSKMSAKVKHIVDIWADGCGVVSVHCFQSVIPVEAYTREACMLEAIGMHKVTNIKRGDFYGIACSWSMQKRRLLGVYLLKKVFSIFLAEGERQIYIPDLKG